METKKYIKDIKKLEEKYNSDIQIYETQRLPLEQYLNTGASVANGDMLFFICDDVFCTMDEWDVYMSDASSDYLDEPFLIWTVGSNESWKPHPTHFGISRKWYDITEIITCHRSSDEFVQKVASLANLRSVKLLDWYVHLQRHVGGKRHVEGELEFDETADEMHHGYDGAKRSDYAWGSNSNTAHIFNEIVEKLKKWKSYEK
jgi:hypothetical protein